MGEWRKTLTSTPYLILFIILISISVGTASALITITLGGNVVVTGTLIAEEYFDNGNIQTGTDATALGGVTNTASGDWSTVGGGKSNTASGVDSTVPGGDNNSAIGSGSTVGGGGDNTASGVDSTVGGGFQNLANNSLATISGGGFNIANNSLATIGGGQVNIASADSSTVGGGGFNTASGLVSTIGGGKVNTASAEDSTVGGGSFNTASGIDSTVGGGDGNLASGFRSTVPGGSGNSAIGTGSFAAGINAKSNHDNTFVWGDDSAETASTASNQFIVKATTSSIFCSNSACSTGVSLTSGQTTWASVSDARLKDNISEYSVLDRLDDYRAVEFDWKDGGAHDVGVMAQELQSIFPELVNQGSLQGEVSGMLDEGIWSVQYSKLGALALQAIKEQQTQIDEQQSLIDSLITIICADDNELEICQLN